MHEDRHQIAPYPLRLPLNIKKWVTDQAKESRRSINSQILVILEKAKAAGEAKEAA